MKTPQVTHQINGAIFQTRPCKFELECKSYNPAFTEMVEVGVKGYPESYRMVEKLVNCTHGGGVACSKWKMRVKLSLNVVNSGK